MQETINKEIISFAVNIILLNSRDLTSAKSRIVLIQSTNNLSVDDL